MKLIALLLVFLTSLQTSIPLDEEEELDFQEELVQGDSPSFEDEMEEDLEDMIAEESLPEMAIDDPADAPSFPVEVDHMVSMDEPLFTQSAPIEKAHEQLKAATKTIEINFRDVFSGSPIIYSILLLLSVFSICIWIYSMLTVRSMEFLPPELIKELRSKLITNQFNEALDLCVRDKHFFCKMVASGILVRKHGLNMMVDTMKSEGKRSTIAFWQRIGLLNDIAIIAPMIGLLGTVLGMFYAFYDMNRSIESVSMLFDGLGISVGTTIAGLVVAIIAMVLHSSAKYRLVRVMAGVENEAQTFAALIDTRAPSYLEL